MQFSFCAWLDKARKITALTEDFVSVGISVLPRLLAENSMLGCTGVSGLTRGLATLPPRWIQESLVVRNRDLRPPRGPLAVHCFCVCSGCALLGHLLGVSRSRERDLLSVLSIYPRIFLCVFIVYRRIVRILCLLLYSAICWCVLVALSVLAKWLAIERPSDDTFMRWGDYLHEAQVRVFCVYFSFVWFVYVAMCSPRPYTIYISYAYGTI